ncbi:V-type proton ATPase subunit H isoform X1 [Thrips palmi]|uniref:V-type proton ATPase subunit H isoform X1 n=1 Tax=Thrips palmi TaxID=161013 RepID=A0A6P9AHX0_THRPL|nr:V-type proton ATPase subunit H isoform X1 [Thrips palmi]
MAAPRQSIQEMIPSLPEENIDMLAATSRLQQQATEIRAQHINWQSYMQSQMISVEDFEFIKPLDAADAVTREAILKENRTQCAKTFLNLLGHVSKDQTIQYILIMIDDLLQEDRSRVEIFREYSQKKRESVWGPFLNLLNRPDGFITNMTARIIAKMACWSKELMEKSDLHFYLTWLKDQLKQQGTELAKAELECKKTSSVAKGELERKHGSSAAKGEVERKQGSSEAKADLEKQKGSSTPEESGSPTVYSEKYLLNNEYVQSVGRCLQMMLRIDVYRLAFVAVDGISTIISVLRCRVNFQVQYQLVFCLWVLTFNPLLAEKMNKFNVIPILADILSDSVKEKVTRIILAVFRNMIEKPTDSQTSKDHCMAMVSSKVLKQLSILEQRKFDDEDIVADIEFLNERLQASVQDLSSFDEYATEVKSGRLEWSPVHRSAQFWRENAGRLNEKNYELLRILTHLLQNSHEALVLAVAAFDIGEYVRHYPRGKHVIEQLGGKQTVMQLLAHDDPNVRYEALLAVQKLMVHNWEYLGRQLEKEQDNKTQGNKPASGGNAVAAKA